MRRLATWPQLACKLAGFISEGEGADTRPCIYALPTLVGLDEMVSESAWRW